MVVKNSVTFEDALNMTSFGKFNYLALLVNFFIITGMTFEIMSTSYLVPASACELNTTVYQQGLMAGAPLLGIMTSHFWGYLADTKGRRQTLVWCMILSFLIGSSASLSPDWIVFSVLKFFSSCTVAASFALAVTFVSECTPQHRRSIMVSLSSTIYLTATGLMAVLCIPVLQLNFSYYIPNLSFPFTAWRLLTVLYATPCALGALTVYLTFESPRYLLAIGEEQKALEVLRGIFVLNTGKNAEEYNVTSVVFDEVTGKSTKGVWSSVTSQTVPLFKPPLLKSILLLTLLFVIVYIAINPFLVWLPFIADGVMNSLEKGEHNVSFCDMMRLSQNISVTENKDCVFNTVAMITVFAINIIIASLNIILLTTLMNYVGRKNLLLGLQFSSGIAGLCVAFVNSWIISTVCLIIFIAGILQVAILSTFTVDIFPTYVKAMAVCLTLMAGRGSSFLGVSVAKNMLNSNCETTFYLFSGLALIGALTSFLLPSTGKKPIKSSIES